MDAPYGNACAHCVRSKTKCVRLSGGSSCHRCHRLGKNCEPAPHTRKRGSRRKRPSDNRRQLEENVDDVARLRRGMTHSPCEPGIAQDGIPRATTPSLRQERLSPQFLPNHYASVWVPSSSNGHRIPEVPCDLPVRLTAPNSQNSSSFTATDHSGKSLSASETGEHAASVFCDFQTHHLSYYPCIYISPHTTVEQFQQDKPFTWLNMRAVLETSLSKQDELGQEIRETIAKRIVMEGERSVDLLLGLLIHISWYGSTRMKHHFSRSGRPYMGVLANIAKALVSELGLDGPASNTLPPLFIASNETIANHCAITRTFTPEERRILLASFIMSVNVSVMPMPDYDFMRWSSEMERSAQHLAQEPECPGDTVLVILARLSRISREALKVMHRAGESTDSVLAQIKPLKDALERTRGSITADLLSNTTSLDNPFEFRRPQYLLACLDAAKRASENYLSFGMPQYTGGTMHVIIHFMHAIQVLCRLSHLDEPWWDRAAAEQSAAVVSYLNRATTRLQEAHAHVAAKSGVKHSIWLKGADKLRQAFPKWSEGLASSDAPVANEEMSFAPIDFNMLDDSWFTDIFLTPAWAA
ncbi:uncharacterized protein EI97DRAFT_442230 [Westerdykella ornata]|uniref:Zn(2)-C6 fungal-type domain-containing protein n=1 Tax=Westerdykella ornata TaxID=318751 RepID=A0A6A6JK35_WESOR|nr:uncharacterized protein EI97DRAFT_442230 [Westerdykella ornata]KAF2276867.1 hypothetical protein EI97DRAFT_442230 [Westerdykella ornata]